MTDENGRIVFNNLSYDTWYCYQEVSAPDGYMLDSTPKAFIIFEQKLGDYRYSGLGNTGLKRIESLRAK